MKIRLTNVYVEAYQQAMFQKGQPAAIFYTDDVQAESRSPS